MENVRHARTRRLVTFGVFCNRIAEYKGRIPKRIISELNGFRLPLTAMLQDESLSKIAANRLQVLELLLQYAEAHNEGRKEEAEVYHEKAIAMHDAGDRLIEEVIGDGI